MKAVEVEIMQFETDIKRTISGCYSCHNHHGFSKTRRAEFHGFARAREKKVLKSGMA